MPIYDAYPAPAAAAPGSAAPGSAAPASPPTSERPTGPWRAVLRHAGTVVAVGLVLFFGVAFSLIPLNAELPGWQTAWHTIGFFAAIGSATAMVWRMSHPRVVLLAVATASLVLPLDPLGPAIALTWLIARGTRRDLAWGVPLGLTAIAVSLLRDAPRRGEASLLSSAAAPDGSRAYLPLWGILLIAVLISGITVAVGFVRRLRAVAVLASDEASHERRESVALRGELSRQEERELIAREMHDTVAHHLSLVSLHAAALEVTAADPSVPPSARAMRDSAHQALEEMRTLISSLRDSGDGGYAGSAPQLHDLGRLVEDARRAGVLIESAIHVPQEPPAPPALTRAVYRIVQEGLTNAFKHAPGSGVNLQVVAVPTVGVTVVVTNWLHDAVPGASGSRAGVIGMSERASALGGSLTAGPEGVMWVLRAWLPWQEGSRA